MEANRAAGKARRLPRSGAPYGARVLRVVELPADKPLQEDIVKKLTRGEKIPVRTLFKGYFEFTPVFSCHMSGNDYPKIEGTDNGVWRRLAVVRRAGVLRAGISWDLELADRGRAAFS